MNPKNIYPGLLAVLLSCLIMTSCAEGEEPYRFERISEASEEYPDQSNHFPILQGGNAEIAQKINSTLTMEFLDLEYGQQEESIFEKIWPDPDSFAALTLSIDFEVTALTDKVYSLSFKGEGCGAYCDTFNRYFTFDLSTGEKLELEDLLTSTGQENVLARLVEFKKGKVDQKIAEADSMLSSPNLDQQDQVYYEDMKSVYMSCFMDYGSLEYLEYLPDNDSLAIKIDRCAPHVMRYVDELGEMYFHMAIADLKGLLSETGHKILE